jgi:hypothetical protein
LRSSRHRGRDDRRSSLAATSLPITSSGWSPADQLVGLGDGNDLLDSRQGLKVAQVFPDCPYHAEDRLLHSLDFLDEIIFQAKLFSCSISSSLRSAKPESRFPFCVDPETDLFFNAHKNKNPRNCPRGSKEKAGDSIHPGLTQSFYPDGSGIKKKAKKDPLWMLRLLFAENDCRLIVFNSARIVY